MDLGLQGRVAVVTGAGAGIGLATARALVAEGVRVVAADLDPSAAAQLGEESVVVPFAADLAQPQGGPAAVAAAVERFGTIDILVNNLGIAPHRDGFMAVSDADWEALIELNFLSAVRCCRAAIPHMVAQRRGAIVSLSSVVGHAPAPYFADYSMTKHLGILHAAGMVTRTKDDNHVRYSIADEGVFELCEQICGGVRRQLDELDAVLPPGIAR